MNAKYHSLSVNKQVGRVTPCAPLAGTNVQNGAHGVTRPTGHRPFISTVRETACRVLALATLLGATASGFAQSTFSKITTGPVVTDTADGQGCAWVDFDGDGDLDLYVSGNRTGASLLYRNDGNGVFTPITDVSIVNAGKGSLSATWVDFDNDGRIDLFVSRQDNGPGLLFRQENDGTFTKTALPSGGFSYGSAWADYDNDGVVDLLVGDSTQSILWHNDGHGNLVAVTNTPIQTAGIGGIITWVDYDNDGDPDVLVTTSANAGPAHLYRNDGHGVFTPITGPLPDRSSYSTGPAWGDYDNDGFPDVFVCRLNSNFQEPLPSFLFHNNRDGTFTQVEQAPFTNDTGYAVSCSWGDYDNDGWLDLVAANFDTGGKNRLYHNKGDGTFERVLTGDIANDLGSSASVAWGDYDRDGFLDLFIANGTLGSGAHNDFLYHNDGNSNAWLTIKCVGTRSNRSAIGAKVRLKATIGGKTFWQLREINTGNGWNQSTLEAHFGLGTATNVETLRIEWPSGTVQEFQNVPAKQYFTVTEPARLVATSSNGTAQFTLHGGRNLQYEIQTSTNLIAWSLLTAITITNANGTALIADTNTPSAARFYRAVLRHTDVVTDWNATAEDVIRTSTPSVPLRARALAILNASMYDAVNGIVRKYQPYFVTNTAPPGARQEAAAAQAAFTTLTNLFPAQSGLLETRLAASLATIPSDPGNSQSIALGRTWGEQVAAAILAWRAMDGVSTPTPPYLGGFAPGQWRSVPDGTVSGAIPQFATVVPFTMTSSSQFRPGPPPVLTSAQYAADVNEVKAIGHTNSAIRTATQTQLTLLWAAVGPLEENAVARSLVPAHCSLVDSARLFALANFATCDAFIAGFDAKYHYGFWRPFHAIRLADTDGNPATEPDLTWTSLIPAPVHPDYVSTHSTATGAAFGVLARLLGDETPFTLSSPTLPGVTADYERFSDAIVEVGLSRIWGGIHFRTACETGGAMGIAIAEQAVANYLLPR